MTEILVFALIRDGEIEENVLGVLNKVKNFTHLGDVSAALLCEQAKDEWISTLGKHGAKKVFVVEAPELTTYLSRAYVKTMLEIIKTADPKVVIGGGLVNVEDLIPRLAVHYNTTCLERVTDLILEGDELIAITPVRDDQAMVKMKSIGKKIFITTRAGAFFIDENPKGQEPEVEKITVSFDDKDRIVKSVEILKAKKTVNLKDAKIIVAGGRGVGGKEKFAIIKELADLLGGEMGATRACTDLHWIEETYEIGQTGQSVSPDLYIAAGISGAPQHICGVKAKTLIAINTDERASIFKYCDYGIVGDLHQILPILKEKIK
ncbi:MAG: electron transfer flavoprotein subunit alpha/FixB family protein [Candidatus Heimdallarchaeum endolithica]|uniref:Electron transfer flavoprotein subunit alpha/FixB family protein n=1 Tax=Candidatus Heimdallarchaeum endolithica TaxID=2876572 RepID=A0A9Y1BRD2_9ARCH|nr:MAG: electron transfer flavoprotein subunit alpha/FixB family protein [Candidatus Heimdallarchaeum endolithica]